MAAVWAILATLSLGFGTQQAAAQSEQGRTVIDHDLTIEAGETVNGDVSVTGGDLTVYGTITGKANVLNGDADIYGMVGRDLTIITGGNITLHEGSAVEGNVLAAGDIILQENSTVKGSVTSLNGHIDREESAQIGGSINRFDGSVEAFENLVNINSPHVAGSVNALFNDSFPFTRFFGWLGLGIFSAVVLILALGVSALLPRRVRISSSTLEAEPGPSIVVGIIAALLSGPIVALATIVLAATIVGIVLIPVLGIAVMLAFLFGFVVVSQWLGRRLHEGAKQADGVYALRQSQSATIVVEVLLGASVILASTILPALFLPVWITGMLLGIVYLISCIGIGSAVLSKFGTLQPRRHGHRRTVVYPTQVHSNYGASLPHPHANTQPLGPAPVLPREE